MFLMMVSLVRFLAQPARYGLPDNLDLIQCDVNHGYTWSP